MSDSPATPTLGTLSPGPNLPPVSQTAGWIAALGSFAKVAAGGYSIRVATSPGTPCAECHAPTGAGPIGCLDDAAVCDRCLIEGCPELGMVLALIAVTRAYATIELQEADERQEALEELGTFAHLYERFAAKAGPHRKFRILPQEDDPASS